MASTYSLPQKGERLLHLITNYTSRIGAGFLLGMMLLITCDVFLRFVFNKPIPGTYELVELMMAAVVSLSLAFCGIRHGHVAVELLTEKLSGKIGTTLSVIHHVVCIIFFCAIAVQVAKQANIIMESETVTALLGVPIYPFMWIMVFGSALLALVYFMQLNEIIRKKVGQ